MLIFDEAVSSLDQQTTEHFAGIANKLKGKVTVLFITRQLPQSVAGGEVLQAGCTR